MIGTYTSFPYLAMLRNAKSIPFSWYPLQKKYPSLTQFVGNLKQTFPVLNNKFGGDLYKPNGVYKHIEISFSLNKVFLPQVWPFQECVFS